MPEDLSTVFLIAASVVVGDFVGIGMSGLHEYIGHGSIFNPQPHI